MVSDEVALLWISSAATGERAIIVNSCTYSPCGCTACANAIAVSTRILRAPATGTLLDTVRSMPAPYLSQHTVVDCTSSNQLYNEF